MQTKQAIETKRSKPLAPPAIAGLVSAALGLLAFIFLLALFGTSLWNIVMAVLALVAIVAAAFSLSRLDEGNVGTALAAVIGAVFAVFVGINLVLLMLVITA